MSGRTKKAIEKIIMFKMMGWLKSITDEDLRKEVRSNLIVSGGCIASMLLGEDVNDYDVYLRDANTAKKLARYYVEKLGEQSDKVSSVDIDIEPTGGWLEHIAPLGRHEYNTTYIGDTEYAQVRSLGGAERDKILAAAKTKQLKIKIKSAGIAGEDDTSDYQYFESLPFTEVVKFFEKGFKTQSKKDYQLLFMSSNAISLSAGVQIITRFIGEPEDIHKCFDFVHVKNYFTFSEGLQLDKGAMECLLSKQLVYNNSIYPVSTIFRMRKFIRRGWSISAGEMFKIMYDISKLNLNSPAVLMEQLTGADVAYFHQVLSMLRNAKEEDINQTYLFELIDRVFKTNELDDADHDEEQIADITNEIRNDAISLGLEDSE